jgi:hypothetical protein
VGGTVAKAVGVQSASAFVVQQGGDGGFGGDNANGGAGASSTLTNAVSGVTAGGNLSLSQEADGGWAGGSSGGKAGAAGNGNSSLTFDDTKNTTESLDVNGIVVAAGGYGGNAGLSGAIPSAGGSSKASVNVTAKQAIYTSAYAGPKAGLNDNQIGGSVSLGVNANGAVGGASTATSNAISIGAQVIAGYQVAAYAVTYGGVGGAGDGLGHVGGAGGVATASASAVSAATFTTVAWAEQVGGVGGVGQEGAGGGQGASSAMKNAVTGRTNGGKLSLTQIAIGGDGGSSANKLGPGGIPGAATSSLTFDDTKNKTQSTLVTGDVYATGGDAATGGGDVAESSIPIAGGIATATLNLTGASATNAAVTASGGAGAAGGAGGNATAVLTAHGTNVEAQSTATGGSGATASGIAAATTTATGTSGSFSAEAGSSLINQNQLIQSISTSAQGVVNGTSVAQAKATIGGASASFLKSSQAVAFEAAAPSAASTAPILASNSAIAAAFGSSPVFFGIDEVGGGYSSGGSIAQTVTTEVNETVDITKLSTRGNLIVGLYNGAAIGKGVAGVAFDLYVDGADVLSKTFTSGTAAQDYFTDNTINLGSLATDPQIDAGDLILKVVLTVTSTSAGSAFYGGILIGDPPASIVKSSVDRFVGALASFGVEANAGFSTDSMDVNRYHPTSLLGNLARP